MLYMTADAGKLHIVVLETGNLEKIKEGKPARTPDGEVLICWTPDPQWLSERIVATGGDAKAIGKLIDEGSKRPQSPLRGSHETVRHEFDKGPMGEPVPMSEEKTLDAAMQSVEVEELAKAAGVKLGATGERDGPPLRPGDEGGLNVAVSHSKGQIVFDFGKSISWASLKPEQAEALSERLRYYAQKARRYKGK